MIILELNNKEKIKHARISSKKSHCAKINQGEEQKIRKYQNQ